jgi:tRNA(Ile)-lysidine synthetase-like protein
MALAHLASLLPGNHEKTEIKEIFAFIVDHGARLGSDKEEAKIFYRMKNGFGLQARTARLRWNNDNLPSAFETVARARRYNALARLCVENDVKHLLLAHHADDQAETVLGRLMDGAPLEGLGGMKAVTPLPGGKVFGADDIEMGRPFLRIPKVICFPKIWQNRLLTHTLTGTSDKYL